MFGMNRMPAERAEAVLHQRTPAQAALAAIECLTELHQLARMASPGDAAVINNFAAKLGPSRRLAPRLDVWAFKAGDVIEAGRFDQALVSVLSSAGRADFLDRFADVVGDLEGGAAPQKRQYLN